MRAWKLIITANLLLIFAICITGQNKSNEESIVLPKPEDVQKIETTNNEFRYQTPESLLRQLPNLSAKTFGDSKSRDYQYGTITLKDGTVLKWKSSHFGNVFLYNDKTEQFYSEDVSFWSDFLGKFVYILTAFVLFTLLLIYFFNQRNHADDSLDQINSGYWKLLLIRISAFLVFVGFAYLLFQSPLQQFHDGIAVMDQKGGPTHYAFYDTEPGNFKFHLILGSSFGVFSLFCGIGFLLFNPKSKFWTKKAKLQIEKTSFLEDK
jgi:hypothetical protein